MGHDTIIMSMLILAIFGIAYYYFTSRNKERLALIEAGANPELFKKESNASYIILVIGLLAIGIALGAGLGYIIEQSLASTPERIKELRELNPYYEEDFEGVYVICVFLFSGISLVTSFLLIRNMKSKEDR